MALYIWWWIAAAILVGAEMLTGTFYLLVVALACVAGGAVAYFGGTLAWQWIVAAVVQVVGTLVLIEWKKRHRSVPKLESNLDLGQRVRVQEWRPDGTARVYYRGAQWEAVAESESTPRQEQMVIVAMRGNILVLAPVAHP
ncbi:MAG: NfeD family protein [Casimicrobiaceae bacterium]|nr:NfeD family protein [Casimicrobiaceae bacterium]MCX8099078.1 NfeD family protein [Casimicrobiaceae bacterium]MDW8312386.1 NfeD family protein [Burkholderiales bacterium]